MTANFWHRFDSPGEESRPTDFVYVMLPEDIEPDERNGRYEASLDAELQLAGVGFVSGGGTALSASDEDEEWTTEYCGVDVQAYDLAAARALLREHLPELGCVAGTQIQFGPGQSRMDLFDGEGWTLDQPTAA
jgi:hypothetical protein